MQMDLRSRRLCAVLAAIGLYAAALPLWAGNGISVTGYGAESSAMGGVDLAMARDTTALNTNPAGLARLQQGSSFDFYLEPFLAFDNVHRDIYNGDHSLDNPTGAVFGGGYARALPGGKLVAGIGLFAQGGVGFVYKDLTTKYGTRDEANTVFGVYKLTPGLAWRVNERLRLGAVLGIAYGQARQKLFPSTSVYDPNDASQQFFGTRFDGGRSLGFNGKFGLQYQPSEALTLALVYTSHTPVQLEHGRLTVNYEAIGMGQVVYRDAEQKGIAIPEEAGIGLAYRLSPRWLLGGELNWINNSASLKAVTLTARNPDAPAPVPEISATQRLDWRDQYVIGIAAEYQYDDDTQLRAGYSHGHNTIPLQRLSPLLALITEDELAIGVHRRLGSQWAFSSSLECQLPKAETYTNPDMPFGPDTRESNAVLLWTLMISRRW